LDPESFCCPSSSSNPYKLQKSRFIYLPQTNQTSATMDGLLNKGKEMLSGNNSNQQQGGAAAPQGGNAQRGGNAGQEDYGDKGMLSPSPLPSQHQAFPLRSLQNSISPQISPQDPL
jgi:hypothetical protein